MIGVPHWTYGDSDREINNHIFFWRKNPSLSLDSDRDFRNSSSSHSVSLPYKINVNDFMDSDLLCKDMMLVTLKEFEVPDLFSGYKNLK